MAVTMADFEAVKRQQGQRGRCRHNNQIEAMAGNVGQWWQQAAMTSGSYGYDHRRQQQWQWQRKLQPQW